MAKQTFTSGQVLTAAQMTSLQSNDYNQTVSAKTANYVLVAADAGTTITMSSATATTITVNTSLFTAGDTLRIQNIGAAACVVTAGTATVTSAGSLSIPQWGGGTLYFTSASAAVYFPNASNNALTLITAQTIGSAVGTVTVSNCFSSTYDNYLVTVNGGVGSVAGDLRLQLNGTTTGYYYSITGNSWSATASNAGSTSIASIPYMGAVETNSLNASITIKSPNLAKRTEFNGTYMTATASYVSSGFLNNLTQYTGLVLAPDSGTLTGGTIRVYGYQNS